MHRTTLMFVLSTLLLAQIPSEPSKLWAGISLQQPVFSTAELTRLQLMFAVVNDGTTTANPNIESSHLLINGVEPPNWEIIIHNGLRGPEFWSLAPGHTLKFGYALGSLFMKPGIYTVRWEGPNFKSADLVFRVVLNPE